MSWLYLLIAGICEIFWAIGIKNCNGVKDIIPLVLVIISMILSITFLEIATRTISMSIAYPVWTGIGIVGVFVYGLVVLKEPISVMNMLFVSMILIGIFGLKLFNR